MDEKRAQVNRKRKAQLTKKERGTVDIPLFRQPFK